MIKKYKRELIIFFAGFLIYFILGSIFSYSLNITNYWSVLFDIDSPRVLGDLSVIDFDHYRVIVHPLFVILFQPITLLIKFIIKDPIIAIILLQSILSSVSLISVHSIMKKIGLRDNFSLVLTILFGLSFGQLVFSSNVETYIFAQFFLTLLWLFVSYKLDKKLNFFDYIILVTLGIGSIGITITNFVQFLIAIVFLIILNKKVQKKWFIGIMVVLITIAFSVLLADIQNIIWPTAPNFFVKNINDLIYGTSEEKLYMSFDITGNKILNVLNSNFAYSLNLFSLIIPEGEYMNFANSIVSNLISILLFIGFVVLNIIFMYKIKFNFKKHKLYYALLLVYLSNFVLHLFYGNSTAFLYVCHYNFSIIIILAYIIKNLNIKFKYEKLFSYIFIFITLLLAVRVIVIMYIKLSSVYSTIDYFRIFPFLIIGFSLIILSILLFDKKEFKLFSIILICLLLYFAWRLSNNREIFKNIKNNYIMQYEKWYLK